MPLSETRNWNVTKSPEEISRIINSKLAEKKATLTANTPTYIEATLGSEAKTRVIGGAFVHSETLPLKVSVNIMSGATTMVQMNIQDNLGFGSRFGMKGKYAEYMQRLFDEFASALQVSNNFPPPPPPPPPP